MKGLITEILKTNSSKLIKRIPRRIARANFRAAHNFLFLLEKPDYKQAYFHLQEGFKHLSKK